MSETTFDPMIWAFPPVIQAHSSCGDDAPDRRSPMPEPSWLQSVDQSRDLLEQFLRHRDLGHLEDVVAGVAHNLGADLHQLLPQAGQRPWSSANEQHDSRVQ